MRSGTDVSSSVKPATAGPATEGWCVVAAGLGVLHALPSVYWVAGGTALVDTVGQWAADWQRDDPAGVAVVLLGVAATVLTGLVTTDQPVDTAALFGHALLWDPLFVLWGGALLRALRRTSPPSGSR